MELQKISEERLSRIKDAISIEAMEAHFQDLGAVKSQDGFSFCFFDLTICYQTSDRTFYGEGCDDLTLAVKTAVATYIRNGLQSSEEGTLSETGAEETAPRLLSFRELSGGGPLFSSVTANTAKTVEQAFAGDIDRLMDKCRELGGLASSMSGYDLSFRFPALPRVPLLFNFNDAEDGMPPQAGFLFRENALQFLDITALGILCTYATGRLISQNR